MTRPKSWVTGRTSSVLCHTFRKVARLASFAIWTHWSSTWKPSHQDITAEAVIQMTERLSEYLYHRCYLVGRSLQLAHAEGEIASKRQNQGDDGPHLCCHSTMYLWEKLQGIPPVQWLVESPSFQAHITWEMWKRWQSIWFLYTTSVYSLILSGLMWQPRGLRLVCLGKRWDWISFRASWYSSLQCAWVTVIRYLMCSSALPCLTWTWNNIYDSPRRKGNICGSTDLVHGTVLCKSLCEIHSKHNPHHIL